MKGRTKTPTCVTCVSDQEASSQAPSPVPVSQPQPPQAPRPVDPAALQQLKDMGFPENRAKKALLLCR